MRDTNPKNRRNPLIYIRLSSVRMHLYPHFRSLFEGLLFRCPSGAKEGKYAVYHRFAKVSNDSPSRKRKATRRKPPGGEKAGRGDLERRSGSLFQPGIRPMRNGSWRIREYYESCVSGGKPLPELHSDRNRPQTESRLRRISERTPETDGSENPNVLFITQCPHERRPDKRFGGR